MLNMFDYDHCYSGIKSQVYLSWESCYFPLETSIKKVRKNMLSPLFKWLLSNKTIFTPSFCWCSICNSVSVFCYNFLLAVTKSAFGVKSMLLNMGYQFWKMSYFQRQRASAPACKSWGNLSLQVILFVFISCLYNYC